MKKDNINENAINKKTMLNQLSEYYCMPAQYTVIISIRNIEGTTIKKGDALLFLGEIQNMKGHIAFADKEGKVWWGYHPEGFRWATDEEI